MRTIVQLVALGAALAAGTTAQAQDAGPTPWYLHVGPGRLDLADGAVMQAGGAAQPDAGIHTEPQWTAIVEIGRLVAPTVAIGLTVGIPPMVKIDGSGSLAPVGRLADVRYGPAAVTAQWHPLARGTIDPYVGAGATYMHVFETYGYALQDVEVDDDIGPVIQGGVNINVARRWGLFADVKKAWLTSETRGNLVPLGGVPVRGRVTMDPLVLNAGIAVRF